jgi:hypothetical protein
MRIATLAVSVLRPDHLPEANLDPVPTGNLTDVTCQRIEPSRCG